LSQTAPLCSAGGPFRIDGLRFVGLTLKKVVSMSKRTILAVCSLVLFCLGIVAGCNNAVEESSVPVSQGSAAVEESSTPPVGPPPPATTTPTE
jgi:predicted small secreted protein